MNLLLSYIEWPILRSLVSNRTTRATRRTNKRIISHETGSVYMNWDGFCRIFLPVLVLLWLDIARLRLRRQLLFFLLRYHMAYDF